MTMITPSYLGETIEYSSLHACRSTLEDPTLNSAENRLRVLIVDHPSHRRIHLSRLCQELGPPLTMWQDLRLATERSWARQQRYRQSP